MKERLGAGIYEMLDLTVVDYEKREDHFALAG